MILSRTKRIKAVGIVSSETFLALAVTLTAVEKSWPLVLIWMLKSRVLRTEGSPPAPAWLMMNSIKPDGSLLLLVIWGMAVDLASWTPCRLAFAPRS